MANDDVESNSYLKKHFGKASVKVIKDAMSKVWISVVCHYNNKVKGIPMEVKGSGASQIYLTEQEYLQSKVDWICKDLASWAWLGREWSSSEWIAKSKGKRGNRGGDLQHTYSGDGHATLEKCMVSEIFVVVVSLAALHTLTVGSSNGGGSEWGHSIFYGSVLPRTSRP